MKFGSLASMLGVPMTPWQMALFTSEVGEKPEQDLQFVREYNRQRSIKGKTNMAAPNAMRTLAQKAGSAIAASAPALKERALDYVKQATNGRVRDVSSISEFAAKGKNAFAIVASGAVKAGINPNDILDTAIIASMNDADLVSLSDNLRREFTRIYGAINSRSSLNITEDDDIAKIILAKETCEFIKRAGLGGNSLRETHAKLKLFISLDDADIAKVTALYPSLK